MSFFDPANFERMARESEESVRRLEEMSQEITSVTGTGESRSGLVVARTDHGGMLDSVRLDPRAMRMGSEELAEELVEAVRAAQQDAQRQGEELLSHALSGEATREPFDLAALQRRLQDIHDTFGQSVDRAYSTVDRLSRRDDW
ncbi:YbaB/EbfC family nucleoid-associated protein [Nonomuraea roseola]|uniref:YbaB/EbfC family nucleoid-associated protein n=1 Tax=Nonomuraea roseola TaxID=46179 RepID=A0ABV5PQG1_9ACTN